jgi:hypothetical protein
MFNKHKFQFKSAYKNLTRRAKDDDCWVGFALYVATPTQLFYIFEV